MVIETLWKVFLQWGGNFAWLFIVALPPQIIRNFRTRTYTSGPRITWYLFALAYLGFGTFLWMLGQRLAAASQYTGLLLTLIILAQSFCYRHAH